MKLINFFNKCEINFWTKGVYFCFWGEKGRGVDSCSHSMKQQCFA